MLYHGAPVTSVPVINLQEGPLVAGRWETFDLVIDYKYQRTAIASSFPGKPL
jgi:hypothetical protein